MVVCQLSISEKSQPPRDRLPMAALREAKNDFKSPKLAGFCLVLILMICFSVSASAMPNPITKAGSASKTVVVKTYDGAKSVAKVPVRFTKVLLVTAGT